jgi:hypothetical protein
MHVRWMMPPKIGQKRVQVLSDVVALQHRSAQNYVVGLAETVSDPVRYGHDIHNFNIAQSRT